MRIGIVCYPTYGGSGAAATELGRQLARRGHQVHIISADRPFRLNKAGYQENLFFHQIPSVKYPVLRSELYTLSCAVRMAQLVREKRLDVLHTHYAVPHAVSAMLARQLAPEHKVRLVTTIHGTDITLTGSNPAFAPVVRMGLASADVVVSVSNWLRDETHKRFGECRRCEVIYNFVDPDEYKREGCGCARRLFAENDEKILLHISNFRPVKRVSDAVRVLKGVLDRGVKAVLLMVGDGPERNAAEDLAAELGVQEQIRFLGLQDDVASLLAIGDLFVFPSEYESFGLAVLEAMASQTPVVCSNGGGLPEVMVQGETGFLCDVGDVHAMAERAVEILRNPELGARLGEAARRRAMTRFSPDVVVTAHEELYRRLIDQAENGACGK